MVVGYHHFRKPPYPQQPVFFSLLKWDGGCVHLPLSESRPLERMLSLAAGEVVRSHP